MMTSIIIRENKEEVKITFSDVNGRTKSYCLSSLDSRKGVQAILSEIDRIEKIFNEIVLEKLDCSKKINKLRSDKRNIVRQQIIDKIQDSEKLIPTKKEK